MIESTDVNLPAISVIAPMYNVENYIDPCLGSILNQTFQDFEVIIVDDCSTDNSFAKAEQWIPKFNGRLKLFKMNKNSGTAAKPRNMGIRLSRGKYLAFIDSDDMFTANALQDLYSIAEETQAEVVHGERYYYLLPAKNGEEQNKSRLESWQSGKLVDKPTLETEELYKRIKRFKSREYHGVPWNKLFSRDFILKNDIQFPDMPTIDDIVFCFYLSGARRLPPL